MVKKLQDTWNQKRNKKKEVSGARTKSSDDHAGTLLPQESRQKILAMWIRVIEIRINFNFCFKSPFLTNLSLQRLHKCASIHCLWIQITEGAGLEFPLHVSAHKILPPDLQPRGNWKEQHLNALKLRDYEVLSQCTDLFIWINHASGLPNFSLLEKGVSIRGN